MRTVNSALATPRSRFRIGLVLIVVLAVVAFFAAGGHRHLDAHAVRERIHQLGALGPLMFVIAFALIQPLGPSGHIFVVGASLVWSGPIAFGLSLVGAVLSQATAFAFYRYVAADWARERIPDRLRHYEQRLVEAPFRTVLTLRLFTFTWPLVSAVLGVSRVRFQPMVLATTLGLAPTVAFDVWFLEAVVRELASSLSSVSASFGV